MAFQRYADAKISVALSGVVVSDHQGLGVLAHVVVAECSQYDHVLVICQGQSGSLLDGCPPKILYSLMIDDELLLDFKETNVTVEIHKEKRLENPIQLQFVQKADFWRLSEIIRYAKMFRLDRVDQLQALHEEIVRRFRVVPQDHPSTGNSSASEVVNMGMDDGGDTLPLRNLTV